MTCSSINFCKSSFLKNRWTEWISTKYNSCAAMAGSQSRLIFASEQTYHEWIWWDCDEIVMRLWWELKWSAKCVLRQMKVGLGWPRLWCHSSGIFFRCCHSSYVSFVVYEIMSTPFDLIQTWCFRWVKTFSSGMRLSRVSAAIIKASEKYFGTVCSGGCICMIFHCLFEDWFIFFPLIIYKGLACEFSNQSLHQVCSVLPFMDE